MNVITAIDNYAVLRQDITCFLAGGITNCWEWQDAVIQEIKNLSDKCDTAFDDLVIFNPRRKNFPIDDPAAAKYQIKWEFNNIERCDVFSMYFSSGTSDQPICMYELGRNILRMQTRFPNDWERRIVISCEAGYKRAQDVAIQVELACRNRIQVITWPEPSELIHAHAISIINSYQLIRAHRS